MKRIIAVILVLAVSFLFVGCKDNASSGVQSDQSKTQTSSENKQTETDAKDLSDDELVKIARIRLGVPDTQDITYKVGEKYYWEAGGVYLKQVDFYQNGKIIAGASVDSTSGALMRNVYIKSLAEKLVDEIEEAYEADSLRDEYASTVGMCELHNKYTKKWKEIADEYYDKIMAYDEDIQLSDAYYSTDDLHTFVSNMKTSWEKYNKEQCENYAKVLQTIYQGGSIIGPLAASYECEMQKEWALQLVRLYSHL